MRITKLSIAALLIAGFVVSLIGYSLFKKVQAASSAQAAQGVYIADFFSSPTSANLSNANIDGFFQAYKWNQVEPSPGSYNWNTGGAPIDSNLAAIKQAGKKVALGIDTGGYTPQWAEPANLSFTVSAHNGNGPNGTKCHTDIIPIPWDPTYQANLHNMIVALSAHLKAVGLYDVVSQVKLSGITEDTEETRMPAESGIACPNGMQFVNAPQLWASNGYSAEKAESAWETMASFWAAPDAFPDKTLGNPVIATNGFPNIVNGQVVSGKNTKTTQDIIDWAASHFGSRYLLMENALNDSGQEPPMSQYAQSKGYGIGYGFQLEDIVYGNAAPTVGSADSFANAIKDGLSYHMTYLEIFPNDPAIYASGLASAHVSLAPIATTGECPNGSENCSSASSSSPSKAVLGACTWTSTKITGPTVTLTPGTTDFSDVKTVTYSLDGKVLSVQTKAPFTYQLEAAKLTSGCHTLSTTILHNDKTTATSNRNVTFEQHVAKWYQHIWLDAIIIVVVIGGGFGALILVNKGLRHRLKRLIPRRLHKDMTPQA